MSYNLDAKFNQLKYFNKDYINYEKIKGAYIINTTDGSINTYTKNQKDFNLYLKNALNGRAFDNNQNYQYIGTIQENNKARIDIFSLDLIEVVRYYLEQLSQGTEYTAKLYQLKNKSVKLKVFNKENKAVILITTCTEPSLHNWNMWLNDISKQLNRGLEVCIKNYKT